MWYLKIKAGYRMWVVKINDSQIIFLPFKQTHC